MQPRDKTAIRASQAAYQSTEIKTAFVAPAGSEESEAASDAVIRRVGDEYPMLLASIGPADLDAETGEMLRAIDFTALRAAGSYFIDVPGAGRSAPFDITDEATAS